MKSFTLSTSSSGSTSRPSTSFTLSRPSTSLNNHQQQQLTDQQRVDSFSSELSRLCLQVASSSSSSAASRDRSSYVLLRRAEHTAIHRALLSTSASNQFPPLWSSLLNLMQTESRSAELLANSISLILLCAGKFISEQAMREFIASRKDTDSSLPHSSSAASSSSSSSSSTASSIASSSSTSYDHVLWNRVWSWDIEATATENRSRVMNSLAAILTPLLLSVHPTKQQLSSVLLKNGSARGVAALEKLWTAGLELVLSLLQSPATQTSTPVSDTLLSLTRVQFHSFSFYEALRMFCSVQLHQAPFVVSNQLSVWRMIEVAFTLFFTYEQSTSTSKGSTAASSALQASVTESKQISAVCAFQKDSIIWMLLSACFHELCRARSCNCCYSSTLSSSSSQPSASTVASTTLIDLFVISSKQSTSPYTSLSSLVLRYLKAVVDDPSQSTQSQLLWDKLPIIQVFLFHCLIFHVSDASGYNSSQIALDAEYLLTRYYFDSKNILKLLPLLVSNDASTSADFTPSVSIYLPKVQEDFLASLQCQHMSYRRDGLKYGVNINALSTVRNKQAPSVSDASSSFNAIQATPHSTCLIRLVVNLMKKYLLLALDLSQSASATMPATSTSTVRVVRDIQGWKIAQQITTNWIRLLYGLMLQKPSSAQNECIPELEVLIQSSILEFYLWNSKATLRVKELFDTAHEMTRESRRTLHGQHQSSSFECADVLYGLGSRILLCLVDSITSSLPSLDAKESSSPSTTSPSQNPFGALLGEYITCLVQDLQSILSDARSTGLVERKVDTEQDGPTRHLQISDVFDMTYCSSQTLPPRVRKTSAYLPILQQVLVFLQSLLPRFSFNLATSAAASSLSVTIPSNGAAAVAAPTLIGSTSSNGGMMVSQPLTPRAPAAVAPLQSPTRLRRPMSSHSHLSSSASLPLSPSGVSRSSAPRAPSYSPPTSAGSPANAALGGLGAVFSPRPPSASSSIMATSIRNVPPLGGSNGSSMSARSSSGGSKHRQYKAAATTAAVSLAPLPPSSTAAAPMPPRAAPPPSSSPRAATAASLKPLVSTLTGNVTAPPPK